MAVDYVIVGAGAAGSVLAERLSADPRRRVLLVEAGGVGRDPLLRVPKAFVTTLQSPVHTIRYPAQVRHPSGTAHLETWLRGRGLGGSTLVNGMVYLRGWAPDYDPLADVGEPRWGWAGMLEAFRAVEDHELGASPLRGAGGPLPVRVPASSHPLVRALLAAAPRIGLTPVADVNASDQPRIGPTPVTIDGGRRVSAANAFLSLARSRPNLTVLVHARVGYLLLQGRRVTGVRLASRGTVRDVLARREVILAAGSLETPLLLERSGIGNPQLLARANVRVRVEQPTVGEGLIEHRAVTVRARARADLPGPLSDPRQCAAAVAHYLTTRSGPLATGPYELVALARSGARVLRPDVQLLMTPTLTRLGAPPGERARWPGLLVSAYQLRPTSAGSVHISGPLPGDPPRIDARPLATADDRGVTARVLGVVRELLATEPVASLLTEETQPGPEVSTGEQVVDYALRTGGGLYHAVGSARIGPGELDVVDAELRVRGVDGLRVVDASVFPSPPSGNTAAPTLALAWQAAGLIAAE